MEISGSVIPYFKLTSLSNLIVTPAFPSFKAAFMAGNTTGLINGGGMALAAGRSAVGDSAPAFLGSGFGMSQIERRLVPVGGIVARSAVRSKCSRMEVWVGVAGNAG